MVGIWSTHPATDQCHLHYCQETFSSEYELDRHSITVNYGVEGQDSLFTLTRLQDIIPEKEVKLIRMTRLQEINPECTIVIKNTKNKIHYVSEWDPRKHAATKGGYLEGEITIPQYSRPMKMTIQTLPAHGKGMKKAIEAGVHPALIHNVIMGRGKRDQGKEPVPTECNWRLEYLIENGRVIALNKISKFDAERNVPQQNEVTQVKNNKIVLGGKRNELSLIIVQPKQRSRGDDATEATLPRVIINKLEATGQDASDINVQELEKCFKGAEFNKNMKQVGLNVDLRDYNTNEPIASCLTSQPICDFTNMHIGPLDLADASPLKSCTNGGRKIMIISEQKLPNKVKPIFEIWSGDSQMKDLEKYLSQPIDFQVRQESIIFLTPHQGFLKGMDWNNLTLKLAVMRTEDKHISSKKFSFRYVPHNSQSCMFCSHNLDTEEQVNLKENKKNGKRKLALKNYKRSDVNKTIQSFFTCPMSHCQSPYSTKDELERHVLAVHGVDIDDSLTKSEMLSGVSYNYENMNVSSPEEEHSFKKLRIDNMNEDRIPLPCLEMSRATVITRSHIQDDTYVITASDMTEFGRWTDTLPNIFPFVMKDGAPRSVPKLDCSTKMEDKTGDYQDKILNSDKEKPKSLYDLFSCFPRLIFLFFVFFTLQIMAFLFASESEEEIPLLQVSSSSFAFSAVTIFAEYSN
eukprot:GFUD01026769.1.p1 GENE.GFUD01026769.1~~GFUD01026769.1.p1  ORF type:complete len:688 (+),score=131.79 GFUD01026769.1:284-2347(+)